MLLLPIIFSNVVTTLYALHTNETDDLSSRVLYGERASIKDYPFFAALGSFEHNKYYCGAVILSKWWLATAAHCVGSDEFKETGKWVWVGEDSTAPTSWPYAFNKVIIYPDYVNNGYKCVNDIALLKLTRPLTFTNNVKPIKLPKRNYELNEVYAVAGMGNDETQQPSHHLMSTNLHTVKAFECLSYLPLESRFIYLDQIKNVTICTKKNGDKPGPCHGDSGSPLIQSNTLIGIASYINNNDGCETATRFAFTNVYPFVGWIKKITGIRK